MLQHEEKDSLQSFEKCIAQPIRVHLHDNNVIKTEKFEI